MINREKGQKPGFTSSRRRLVVVSSWMNSRSGCSTRPPPFPPPNPPGMPPPPPFPPFPPEYELSPEGRLYCDPPVMEGDPSWLDPYWFEFWFWFDPPYDDCWCCCWFEYPPPLLLLLLYDWLSFDDWAFGFLYADEFGSFA